MMKPLPGFLPLLLAKNCGDSGDKPAESSIHAGLQRTGERGQSGGGTGTKRGQFYMMKDSIIHSSHYCPVKS